jgi:hypothetical protein
LHSPDLVQLVKEAVATMSVVVTVQEAAALHVLQRVSLRLCLFCAQLAEMLSVLVTQGRKSEVEHVRIH